MMAMATEKFMMGLESDISTTRELLTLLDRIVDDFCDRDGVLPCLVTLIEMGASDKVLTALSFANSDILRAKELIENGTADLFEYLG